MKTTVDVFCLEWHAKGGSAIDLLQVPFGAGVDINWHYWDGSPAYRVPEARPNQHIIFFQFPPPPNWKPHKDSRVVWLPMWDMVRLWEQAQWLRIPKSIRVVAFTKGVYERAVDVGLQTIQLRYFKDPNSFKPVSWENGPVLFYWNRTNLLAPDMLPQLASTLSLNQVLFRGQNDPHIPPAYHYSSPSMLGNTPVTNIPIMDNRKEFLRLTQAANILVAPRQAEGVGMTFLEAMARGAVVFAYDNASMNEYITSGVNGYLFKRRWTLDRLWHIFRNQLARARIGSRSYRFLIHADEQDWGEISSLNLEALGKQAREDHFAGHQAWVEAQPQYLDFVLFR